jgi:uncharacterized protein (TIGR02118 family)
MVKLLFCLRRLPHLTREEFQRYWRENHAPLVAARAEVLGIRRYVQRHSVDEPLYARMGDVRGGLAPFDGIAELWWEHVPPRDATHAEAARRANRELLEDERRFIDLAASPIFFVDDHEVIAFGR